MTKIIINNRNQQNYVVIGIIILLAFFVYALFPGDREQNKRTSKPGEKKVTVGSRQ